MDIAITDFIVQQVYTYLLVASRVTPILMFSTGFGENYIPSRVKAMLTFIISAVAYQSVLKAIPGILPEGFAAIMLFATEAFVGLAIGLMIMCMLSMVQFVSHIFALQGGLSYGAVFDPSFDSNEPYSTTILYITMLVLVFSTETHHSFIEGIIRSYDIIVPGDYANFHAEDLAETFINRVMIMTKLAVKLSAPFILCGFVFLISSAVLSRIAPALQVFIVLTPLQIIIALVAFQILAFRIVESFISSLGNYFG